MNIQESILAVASLEVGIREQGGNNLGQRIFEYGRATWLPEKSIVSGIPWCAAFCCWVLRAALIKSGVPPARTDAFRCKDASAFGWVTWAQRASGVLVIQPDEAPKPADIVVFDFNGPGAAGGGHIGIVEMDVAGETFHTIEGNTGAAGGRETTDGSDGVCRKSRGTRSVVNFIRLPATLT